MSRRCGLSVHVLDGGDQSLWYPKLIHQNSPQAVTVNAVIGLVEVHKEQGQGGVGHIGLLDADLEDKGEIINSIPWAETSLRGGPKLLLICYGLDTQIDGIHGHLGEGVAYRQAFVVIRVPGVPPILVLTTYFCTLASSARISSITAW